ncbi:hypothetical protein PENSPDRAFT_62479 [Peniophora sp. CONT]|nr:hypothetical protein PENSPDRAFT_62479 [Peniophora sp. CONT]
MADSHPDKPTRLNNLGSSLVARFGRTGELDVLEKAISTFSQAVELSLDDHPDNAMRWTNLGSSLLTRFQRLGRLEDLEEAIFAHAHAVELTPDGHFDKLSRLNNLGASFLARFKRVGELDDVQRAIAVHHHAIASIPEGHPKKPWWYNNLGDALFMRFERTGELQDLDRAIASHRCAIELTPDDHPDKSSLVNSLGIALLRRFERFGILQDLDSSILLRQHALELTPVDHPSTPLRLYEFGNSVLTRFERTGELDFLERAISAYRHAIELTPEGHTDKPSMFDSLGRSLAGRYGRTGEFEDLESSISLHRRAIELSPDGHPDKPLRIDHLATSLSGRFERTGELEDLDGAIEAYRSALERTPDGHAYKPMRMGNLCGGLCMRFEHYKDLDDLESALLLGHSSIDLIPEGHPELAGRYNTLAVCYQRRFELMGHSEDLASAVSMFQKAIELTPDGHPGLSLWFANLAGVLGQLFVHSQTQLNFDSAIQSFMASIRQPLGTPSIRLQSARRCLHMLLSYPGFSSVESLQMTYSSVIAVLPEIVWLGYSIHRRFDESESLGVLVTAAVSSAIEAGSLNQAVEWFEAGRTLIWSQLLALRMPLDELQEKQPNLADSLRSVQQQLQQSAPNSFVSESTTLGGIPGVTSNTAADRHRQLVIKYDSILKDVRSCAGFEDFLRPKRLQALIPSPELLDGPVVFVNVHPIRRDAVILSPDGNITSILLTDLSFERAVELRRLWVNDAIGGRARVRGLGSIGDFEGELNPLKTYLGHMWNWIVRPILEALDLASLVRRFAIQYCATVFTHMYLSGQRRLSTTHHLVSYGTIDATSTTRCGSLRRASWPAGVRLCRILLHSLPFGASAWI